MINFLFTILGVFSVQSFCIAEEASIFSGRIFSDGYLPTKRPVDTSFKDLSTSLWLNADPTLGDGSAAHATFALHAPLDSSDVETDLREAYLIMNSKSFEARVGRQIIPLGSSDVVNPTDFLSVKDMSILNPEEHVKRVGATSLWLSYTPDDGSSPLSFTGVWTPLFPRGAFLLGGSVVPENMAVASPILPDTTLANSETAFKASYMGLGWDFSVIAFRGWNHLPEFTAVSSTVIAPTHHRIRAAGADGSFVSGDWVLRAESAYVWTENDDGLNPLVSPSRFDIVVGVERPFGDDFRAQFQGLWRTIPNWIDPAALALSDPLSAQIASINALLHNTQYKSRTGATFRFSYAPDGEPFEAEIFMIGNFVGGDYLLRPKATYAFTDAFKGVIGVDHYGGPIDRPLGALASYNSLFLEARYVF